MRSSTNFIVTILLLLMLAKVFGATGMNGTNTTESMHRGCFEHIGLRWYAVNSSFSFSSCLSCKCNENGTLTCYRSAAPIRGRICAPNESSTSPCLTKETPPIQVNQFCFNCKTNKRKIMFACMLCFDDYNAKSYYHREEWNPSSCITCNCRKGYTNCTYQYEKTAYMPKFKARCRKCNTTDFVRAYPCISCMNYVTGRNHSSGSTWWINSCFICMCFRGRTYCRREGKIATINDAQSSQNYPLCRRCSTYKLVSYMRRFQCKTCRDDHNRLIRLHNETFYIAYSVVCRCRDGVIQCNITIAGAAREISTAIACNNCSTINIKNLMEAKDKTEFFKKYGSKLTMCKNHPEVVFRKNLCDGRTDCADKTDEENCTAYYCISNTNELNRKAFLWPRTRVGVVKKLDCKHIYPQWKGTLYRPCKIDANRGTFWPKMDTSNCTESLPDPFNITELANASATDLKNIAKRILDYRRSTVKWKRSIEFAIMVADQTLSVHHLGRTSTIKSMAQILVRVMNSGWNCYVPKEQLFITLQEKLEKLQGLHGFSIDMSDGLLCVYDQSFTSNSGGQFTPEDLFKEPIGTNVDNFQVQRSPQLSPVQQRTIPTDTRTTEPLKIKYNNDSIFNASQVNTQMNASHNSRKEWRKYSQKDNKTSNSSQKVEKKISVHVKIIFGLDAFISSISLLSLFIVLFFLFSLRLPKSTKWFIRKNLFVAVTISLTFYVVSIWSEYKMIHYRWLCTTFVLSNYYAILAFYSWMSVEGVNLIIHIVLVLQRKPASHRKTFVAIGWGLPLVALAICLAVKPTAFIQTKGCIGLGKHSWMFKGPAAVLIAANSVMYVIIGYSLIKNARSSKKLQASVSRTRSNVRPFLTLLPLLGVTYVLGFTIDSTIVMRYIYVLVSSAMGLVFTVVTFFMDSQVKESLKMAREHSKPADTNNVKENLRKVKKNAILASPNHMRASPNQMRSSTDNDLQQNAASSMLSIIVASPNPKSKGVLETKM